MPTEGASPKLRILIVNSGIDANGSCPHYPQFFPSRDCPYPGWCLEIIDVLLRSGNISHEFIVDRTSFEDLDWGTPQDNGRFSGILGRVESGDVDMACMLFQKSALRLAHFDYSVPISDIRPIFVVREIPVTFWSLILNCLRPYDTSVWIGMLVALIVQMFVWTIIGRAETRVGVRPKRSCGQYFAWDVFEEMFHAGDHPFFFISGKLARLIFSVFQKGLFLAMYTALLLTALLTPADNAPIKSQTDAVHLIQSGRYKLLSDKTHWFAQEIELSSEKIFVDLREATKNNPIIDTISDPITLELVSEGGYIFQTADDEAAFPEAARQCFTFIFSKDMPSRSAHFIFRKESPWADVLNAEIMKNYDFIDQVHKRYFQNRQFKQPICEPGLFATPGAIDPLNFWSVSGIFVLGTCGMIISTIFLIIEVIVAHTLNLYE